MFSLDTSMSTPAGPVQLSAQQEAEESLLTPAGSGAPGPTLSVQASTLASVGAAGLLSPRPGGYQTAAQEAAAALVDLSGASPITVDDYEASAPPNLAAASALLDELTRDSAISLAAKTGVYQLLDSAATLALTGE